MGLERLGVVIDNPELNTCSGPCLVVGGARCVWEDLSKVDRGKPWSILCVNDVIMHFPAKLHHVYSNDHRMLPHWVAARRPIFVRDLDKGERPMIHTSMVGGPNMVLWPWPGNGSSGMNAALTAIALGYDDILLVGMPLDDSGHYFEPPWVRSNFTNEVPDRDGGPRHWRDMVKVFDGKVRSMSGRTRELLGGPLQR